MRKISVVSKGKKPSIFEFIPLCANDINSNDNTRQHQLLTSISNVFIHFSAAPISQGSISFKWCVTLAAEMTKCQSFIHHVNKTALGLQLKVAVGCVNGSSYEDCMAKIKAREADLVTLDAEHLYAAGTLIHTI